MIKHSYNRGKKSTRTYLSPSNESQNICVSPTPQTLSKRKGDVLLMLVRQGRITPDHFLACEEIRQVWESWCRGLFPSARRLDGMYQSSKNKKYRDPIDRMQRNEFDAWSRHYLPWSQEMRVAVLASCAITRHQLVMDIVVDNFGPRQIEDYYGMRHGTAVPFLRGALDRYCVIAGWTQK